MKHSMTVGAEDRKVGLRIKLGGTPYKLREGREMVSLDVASADLALPLFKVEAADHAVRAVVVLC